MACLRLGRLRGFLDDHRHGRRLAVRGTTGGLVEVAPPARVDAAAVLPVHLEQVEREDVVAPEVVDQRVQERVGSGSAHPTEFSSRGSALEWRGEGRFRDRPHRWHYGRNDEPLAHHPGCRAPRPRACARGRLRLRFDRLPDGHAQRRRPAGAQGFPRRPLVPLDRRQIPDERLGQRPASCSRPKVDFEHGLVRPGFHQDLGGTSRFLQVDLAYGLTGHTTLLASAPVLTHRSYDIGHPPVLTENYKTSGIGDTLGGVRHALIASPSFSLVASAGLEMPTGDYRLVALRGALRHRRPRSHAAAGQRLVGRAAERPGLAPHHEGRARPHGSASPTRSTPRTRSSTATGTTRSRASPWAGPIGSRVRASLQAQVGAPGPQRVPGRAASPPPAGTIIYAIPGLSVSARASSPPTCSCWSRSTAT